MAQTSLIGNSPQHFLLLEKLSKVAITDAEILITGPSGVGKELYARYAHQHSLRNKAAFVPVNCGALPPELFENELFGHVGGAFTGARPESLGLVAAAESGTLFLDEVDSLAPICQVKLLRFLQEKEYRRLGENRLRKANVRILAATNTDLVSAVRDGLFRQDLFFRLRVIPVEVPPLRERPCDIPMIANEYAARFAEQYRLPKIAFTRTAKEKLKAYSWPGNIRELVNCVNYLTCLQLGRMVEPGDLPLLDFQRTDHKMAGSNSSTKNNDGRSENEIEEGGDGKNINPVVAAELKEQSYNKAKRNWVDHFERQYVEEALRRSGGNIAQAARASEMPRRVFFERMRKHGIKAVDFL
jgi:transcriptional regulator with GAF, ATPase, and Fis domain